MAFASDIDASRGDLAQPKLNFGGHTLILLTYLAQIELNSMKRFIFPFFTQFFLRMFTGHLVNFSIALSS